MNIDIQSLTQWSAPREVQTKNGPRILRKGPLTEAYRSAWRANKEAMKEAGLTMAPVDRENPSGDWQALWWAKIDGQEAARRQAVIDASRAVTADVSIPAPAGMAYMPFQLAGIAAMRDRPATLLADQMGLGKTIQAIGVVNADPSVVKVLVVCPASLKINWRNELKKWLVRPLRVEVQKSGQPWCGDAADVVVLNYDILGKYPQIYTVAWDMLVADECHFVKNPKAQRTRLLLGSRRKGFESPGVRARRRLFLTGTPILNRPVEIFPLLESLQPGKWTFRDKIRYCAGFQGRWGWDFSGAAHLDELQERLRSSVMVRRMKCDVLTDLPPKRRQIVELPSDDCEELCQEECSAWDESGAEMAQARADMVLADASDDEIAYRAAADRLRSAASVAFARISELRHRVALAKVPAVVDHIKGVMEDTGKLVLFAHHLDVIGQLMGALKEFSPLCVTGETKQDLRQGIVDLFNGNPDHKILILGIHAAGVGLSVKASVEVFAELDWVPGIVSQAEDRCHGIGRGIEGEPLQVQHLVLERSLDARMVRAIVHKQEIADKALDKGLAAIEASEPITSINIDLPTKAEMAKEALTVDARLHDAVLEGMQRLAKVCDYAASKDDHGFNGCDAPIGHSLASRSQLTPKQVVVGRRILIKYHRQLPDHINEIIRERKGDQ